MSRSDFPPAGVSPSDSSVLAQPPTRDLPASVAAGGSADHQSWTWVPIRSLAPRHRTRIAAHLLELEGADRYLRFGYAASDAQVSKYVDTIDFAQDEVFGIFNRRLQLIALAHLANASPRQGEDGPMTSEFGVSVLPRARSRGFGRRLFEHAVLHARNRGVDSLMIHALSENTAMLRIARGAGATVVREGSESDALLKLPPETWASRFDELFKEQAAELDYRFKVRAQQFSGLLDALDEVKTAVGEGTHVARE